MTIYKLWNSIAFLNFKISLGIALPQHRASLWHIALENHYVILLLIFIKPMCCQEKWGSIYGKSFFNLFPVPSKILLKFFKSNHRYHIDMSFHSVHKITTKRLVRIFNVVMMLGQTCQGNQGKFCIFQPSVEMETLSKFHSIDFHVFQKGNKISALL